MSTAGPDLSIVVVPLQGGEWLVSLLAHLRVLLGRGIRALAEARVPDQRRVWPHLAWMSGAWSAGESAGYLLGPGTAEQHWR